MDSILRKLPVKRFAAGETLIRQGQKPDAVYFLLSGRVSVLVNDDIEVVKVDKHGAVFGESSVLLGEPANATVRALDASTFAVLSDLSLLDGRALGETACYLHLVARTLALRVHTMNKLITGNKGLVTEEELIDALCRVDFDKI